MGWTCNEAAGGRGSYRKLVFVKDSALCGDLFQEGRKTCKDQLSCLLNV